MEKIHSHDGPSVEQSADKIGAGDSWERFESLNPDEIYEKLSRLFDYENIQRAKQLEVNQSASASMIATTQDDIEKVSNAIVVAQADGIEIMNKVRSSTGDLAALDFEISIARELGKDIAALEEQRARLLEDFTPHAQRYKTLRTKLDWMQAEQAMHLNLSAEQSAYVTNEAPKWEVSAEYKQALGQLAALLETLDRLPVYIPVPTPPPDLSSQNPTDSLPLSLGGDIEAERLVYTFDIENQVTKARDRQKVEKGEEPETEYIPKVRSYRELAELIPTRQIRLPRKKIAKLNQILHEDEIL